MIALPADGGAISRLVRCQWSMHDAWPVIKCMTGGQIDDRWSNAWCKSGLVLESCCSCVVTTMQVSCSKVQVEVKVVLQLTANIAIAATIIHAVI